MSKSSRRKFLQTAGLAVGAGLSAPVFSKDFSERLTPGTYREPSKEIPILAEYDVVVCGGGPSGCAAAISAVRLGAKTLLLEKEGHPGGSPVSQLVAVILSTNGVDFQGIWHEYAKGLKKYKGIRELVKGGDYWSSVNPEMVKRVWEELLVQAGVDVLYHCYTSSAIVENKTMKGVVVETRSGTVAVKANRVIDCTGDGIVCHQAGATWEQGDGTHKYAMALTKVFRIANVNGIDRMLTDDEIKKLDEELTKAIEKGD
jgi:flavin-dependent dehydrogenase